MGAHATDLTPDPGAQSISGLNRASWWGLRRMLSETKSTHLPFAHDSPITQHRHVFQSANTRKPFGWENLILRTAAFEPQSENGINV